MGALGIASDVAGAAGALAGLILVFFGAALSSFDTYDETQKGAVRAAYRRRAWPAFAAFLSSMASCGLALHAQAFANADSASLAVMLLAAAGFGVFVSATLALLDLG